MITVFHYTGMDRLRVFDESAAALFPVDYTRVARVDAPTLEAAYAVTQHYETPWTDDRRVELSLTDAGRVHAARAVNPDVNSSVVLRRRSTAVGDVLLDSAGDLFLVARVGFTKLPLAARARLLAA